MREGIFNPDKALKEIGKLDRRIIKAQTALDEKIARLREEATAMAGPLIEEKKRIEAELESYCVENKKRLFHGARNAALLFGVVGFKKTPGKMEGPKDEALIARLKAVVKKGWTKYVKVRVSPNKDTIKTLPVETLKELGVKIVREDRFYYEVDESALENAIEDEAA
ncbi:MAG: host-nuclease inhibitor Gam family protein [Nitrospinae bacterium]|nr:host-nuclease inhibitor Gam family protein [Nitrospinota bacterium]